MNEKTDSKWISLATISILAQAPRHKILLTLSLLFIVIGNTGIWIMPNLEAQFLISKDLLINPFPDPNIHYLLTNYLQPFIFGLFGGNNFYLYIGYSILTVLIYFFIFSHWYQKSYDTLKNKHSIFSIIVFPSFMVPFYWVGMDGMTLLLMLLIMINLKTRWSILFSIFLGIQHFEQGIASFLLLAAAIVMHSLFKKKSIPIKEFIVIIISILLGKAILSLWFYTADIELLGNRSAYAKKHFPIFSAQWLGSWPYILYSLFGVGWLLVLSEIKKTWPLIISTFVVYILTFFVGDQTRVGAIVLFPSLFYWVFLNKEIINGISPRLVLSMLSIYLIVPVVYVWGGQAFGSLIKSDIKTISKIGSPSFKFNPLSPFIGNNSIKKNHKIKYNNFFNYIEYKASSLPSQIGNILNDAIVAKEGVDKSGYITFGPYISLPAGRYKFDFIYESSEANNLTIGNWDIVIALANEARLIKKGEITGTKGVKHHITESFIMPEDFSHEQVEIRNLYNGIGNLTIYNLKIEKL